MKNWEEMINTVVQGDCLEIIKHFPDKSIDLILTDPPYGINYKGENRPNEINYDDIQNDNKQINYKVLIKEFRRIAKKTIIFGAENFYQDLPHQGRWICWDKRLTENADKMLGSAFELAWVDVESGYYKMYRVLHGGVVNADNYLKQGSQRFHPTQKPTELMAKIIQDFTENDDLVLDPFVGSGTTCIAAKQLGRNFIGIELSEKYCKIARQRLKQDILL